MGMDKELQEVESFADRILRSYFCESDVEFLISTFAEDIVWMGAGERQKAEGRLQLPPVSGKGRTIWLPVI